MDKNLKDTFPQAKSFEEFRREISIIELATAYGYVHEVRKGLRSPVFYHAQYQDRIIILNARHPANQGYWNPEDDADKGTLIHFVKRRLGTVFPAEENSGDISQVNRFLYQYLRLDPFVRQRNREQFNYEALAQLETRDFSLDNYTLLPLAHTGFFTSRKIAPETLLLPEFKGKIFQVQHQDPKKPGTRYTNTAFPFFLAQDDKIVGLEIRNANFKSHAEGSNRSSGVWHSNLPAQLDRIVMVESALDALAYQELKKQSNILFVSYGGNLTVNQVQTIKALKRRGLASMHFQFVSASDNDKKGAYYDLLFIRELVADNLPSQRLAHPRNYIRLVFASPAAYKPETPGPADIRLFGEALADRLQAFYQAPVPIPLNSKKAAKTRPDPLPERIQVQAEGKQVRVQIPNNFAALNLFNHKFIQAAGLEQEVRLDKALLNDYNEDLMLIKMINQHPELLADLNKKDLRRKPGQPLSYLDLKFVLLQPGRYEEIGRVFGLVKVKEEGNPILKFPPPVH